VAALGNPYVYVTGDPVNLVDPDGFAAQSGWSRTVQAFHETFRWLNGCIQYVVDYWGMLSTFKKKYLANPAFVGDFLLKGESIIKETESMTFSSGGGAAVEVRIGTPKDWKFGGLGLNVEGGGSSKRSSGKESVNSFIRSLVYYGAQYYYELRQLVVKYYDGFKQTSIYRLNCETADWELVYLSGIAEYSHKSIEDQLLDHVLITLYTRLNLTSPDGRALAELERIQNGRRQTDSASGQLVNPPETNPGRY
jgi:hypothetical protein